MGSPILASLVAILGVGISVPVGTVPAGSAQQAPCAGAAEAAPGLRVQVAAGVREVLEGARLEVLGPVTLERALRRAGADPCGEVDCAPRVLDALSLVQVAVARVWLDDEGQPTEVSVRLVRADGQSADVMAVDAHGVRAAAVAATAAALLGGQAAGRVHLFVDGTPEGAAVAIDRRPVGQLPYEGWHPPASVELSVSADGYAEHTQQLEIPAGTTEPVEVTVALEEAADGGGGGGGARGGSGRAVWGPVLVGIVGVGVTTAGLWGVLHGDTCVEAEVDGTCLRIREPNTAVAALYTGAGVAMITTAILWWALSGDSDPAASDADVRVSVGPQSITIRSHF